MFKKLSKFPFFLILKFSINFENFHFCFQILTFVRNFHFSEFFGICSDTQFYNSALVGNVLFSTKWRIPPRNKLEPTEVPKSKLDQNWRSDFLDKMKLAPPRINRVPFGRRRCRLEYLTRQTLEFHKNTNRMRLNKTKFFTKFLHFLHQNVCIFYTKFFFSFLHQNFCIFVHEFFNTKNITFLHQKFFKFRKRFLGKKLV